MQSGPDSLSPAPGFTARRSAASQLHCELPPPPLSNLNAKYPQYAPIGTTQPSLPSCNVSGVGNLLTPPNTLPGDNLTPLSPGSANHASSVNAQPNTLGSSAYWPPSTQSSAHYGLPPVPNSQWIPPRKAFSPTSLNSIMTNGDVTQPIGCNSAVHSANEMSQFAHFQQSAQIPSSAALPSVNAQHGIPNVTSVNGVLSPAPSLGHGVSSSNQMRHPSTPSYYSHSLPSPSPNSAALSFPASSSPTHQTSGSSSSSSHQSRVSPPNSANDMSNMQLTVSQSQASPPLPRPVGQFSLPAMNGPVMSNLHSPNTQMALVGGMSSSVIPNFTSGHAASMQQMYGVAQPPSHQPSPATDRPFKCDQCMQSFNRNHDLKRHKRIHLAVKPYPCGHCDKSFSRKDALKVCSRFYWSEFTYAQLTHC